MTDIFALWLLTGLCLTALLIILVAFICALRR